MSLEITGTSLAITSKEEAMHQDGEQIGICEVDEDGNIVRLERKS